MQGRQDDEETNTATERPRFQPARRGDVVAPAERIGRFMVLGRVGAGGMGQVYAAYDPRLDRRVALKLLHAEQSEKDRDGLVREAKALARLNHPNVVAVYDVGLHEGAVFVAMEFVEGTTLKTWMSRTRGAEPAAALELLAQAARGLEAAHEAGLVHGDFKPHNVLVGTDGRARVADFGLARAAGSRGRGRDPADRTLSDSEASQEGSRRVIAGTPAYMAPEHARRGIVDARTDQYSFCVGAWEVLHGRRPPAVAEALSLPAVLVAALKKGLSERPLSRHRSLAPLLRALESAATELRGDHLRRLRSWLISGAAVVVGGAVVGGYWLGRGGEGDAPCTGADVALAKVWNDAARDEVSAALLATGVPYAEHTDMVVRERLDAYGESWVAGHTDACTARVVRHEQSAVVMDARMACLDQRRRELGSVVNVLRAMGEAQVMHAVRVVDGLPDAGHCEDLAYVQASDAVPAEPALRSRVAEVRETLAAVAAMQSAGRYADAESGARGAVEAAKVLEFRPLEAEAQLGLGRALDMLGRADDAAAAARGAFLLAQTAAHDVVAMNAALVASLAAGVEGNDKAQGLLWNDLALALARRVEPENGALVARVLDARASVLNRHGDNTGSRMLYDQALALHPAGSSSRASALAGRGSVRDELGEVEGSIEDQQEAVAIFIEQLGPQHPTVAAVHLNLSDSYSAAGRYEDALRAAGQAKDAYVALQGPDGRDVASSLSSMAHAHRHLGEPEHALALHQASMQILTFALGPGHVEVGTEHLGLGIALVELERYEEALAACHEASAIVASELGTSHPVVTSARMEIANILALQGKPSEARALYEQLLEGERTRPTPSGIEDSIRANFGLLLVEQGEFDAALEQYARVLELTRDAPQSFGYQTAVADQAEVYLALGRLDDALTNGEQLLRLSNEDPTVVAQAQFLVARVLWNTGGDRDRARQLALEAEAAYASVEGLGIQLGEVRAWQKAHR
ncbi:MAG: tetratricopeptide repeat protein [Nannocystales bacterium]